MKRPTPDELQVTTLGQCRFESPLGLSTVLGDGRGNYMSDATRVLADIEYLPDETLDGELSFERWSDRRLYRRLARVLSGYVGLDCRVVREEDVPGKQSAARANLIYLGMPGGVWTRHFPAPRFFGGTTCTLRQTFP